jgi:hypothetical protein
MLVAAQRALTGAQTARESDRRDLIYPWYGRGGEHQFFFCVLHSLNLLFSATRAEIDVHALVPKGAKQHFCTADVWEMICSDPDAPCC